MDEAMCFELELMKQLGLEDAQSEEEDSSEQQMEQGEFEQIAHLMHSLDEHLLAELEAEMNRKYVDHKE